MQREELPVEVENALDAIEFEGMLMGRQMSPQNHPEHTVLSLDRSAYTLMSRIEIDGPLSIPQMSAAFALDASTLNRQTAAMMRKDLIRRIPDPDGGIARKFELTPHGMELLEGDRDIKRRGLRTILAAWSAEEVTTFAALLHRFNSDVEAREGRPWPRPTH
ncbi:MarR family winged helix-turn-helix transcriptional regulator [Nocardioides sp. Bht2]|uniref:MarR family winged helix-turn-helix transcriptional regulator n=1 Tax=Nocardioides sp. Bht2 TaxID=3392297 RepID=UPI0039B42DEB